MQEDLFKILKYVQLVFILQYSDVCKRKKASQKSWTFFYKNESELFEVLFRLRQNAYRFKYSDAAELMGEILFYSSLST